MGEFYQFQWRIRVYAKRERLIQTDEGKRALVCLESHRASVLVVAAVLVAPVGKIKIFSFRRITPEERPRLSVAVILERPRAEIFDRRILGVQNEVIADPGELNALAGRFDLAFTNQPAVSPDRPLGRNFENDIVFRFAAVNEFGFHLAVVFEFQTAIASPRDRRGEGKTVFFRNRLGNCLQFRLGLYQTQFRQVLAGPHFVGARSSENVQRHGRS